MATNSQCFHGTAPLADPRPAFLVGVLVPGLDENRHGGWKDLQRHSHPPIHFGSLAGCWIAQGCWSIRQGRRTASPPPLAAICKGQIIAAIQNVILPLPLRRWIIVIKVRKDFRLDAASLLSQLVAPPPAHQLCPQPVG